MEGQLLDPAFIAELATIVRYVRKNGLWGGDGRGTEATFFDEPIRVKNLETESIPAYACMQVNTTVDEDGRNYVKVEKPDGSGLLYLFNGPYEIESEGYGVAQRGPVYRGYKSTGTVTAGNRWAPTSGQWYLTLGAGQYVVVGADDIATDVFRVMESPVTRLYRFTLNASLASGTADADILEMDGTDTGIDATVRDPLGIFASMTSVGATGYCIYQDGKYWVIQAPCPA